MNEPLFVPNIFTAKELMAREIQEPMWIVPGLIPYGLTLLAGASKTGKSWLALGLSIAVANGTAALGRYDTEEADVLYMALEDSDYRLHDRIFKIMNGHPFPEQLHLTKEWTVLDKAGISVLKDWLLTNHKVKLVIIDVFAKIKKPMKGRNWYENDYEAMSILKKLCEELSLSMILVVHFNKRTDFEDSFHSISGSTGLTGAADTIILLNGNRKMIKSKLTIVGRDIDQNDLTITFNKDRWQWLLEDDTDEDDKSDERKAIILLLQKTDRPMRSAEIAKTLDKKDNAVRQLLPKLLNGGDIIKTKRGLYTIPNNNNNNNNNDNNGNTNNIDNE